MANCVYRFGEFEGSEFYSQEDLINSEFFFGYLDCSEVYTNVDCNKITIYAKPYVYSQWDTDKQDLEDYVRKTLITSIKEHNNKSRIGKEDNCILFLNLQTKALIDYLLYFKRELKLDPTIDNYNKLFKSYKLDCINNQWKCNYRLNNWIKDMLNILDIANLINLDGNVIYIYNPVDDSDPLYYIYNP